MTAEIEVEYVDITPHKSIMPKIGRAGYSVAQAVAELIDNAIDANSEGNKLSIEILIKKDIIEIKDDAVGMNKMELTKAFSLAHSNKKDKLGEFGLGLKTSCQSLGSEFSILTTKKGEKNYYLIDYDEEDWLKNESHSWSNYPIKILPKKDKDEHGTTITIKKLKVKIENVVEKVKKDIGTRFAPFLKRKEVEIKLNNSLTKSFMPELIDGTKKEFEISVKGNKIYGWYGLMKESSQKGFYGFNIFRRGRMITCYDKIGIGEHATVARITGEINLNHVPVTHNKREFINDSEEYIDAEEVLSKEFKEIVKEARKKAKDDKVTSNVKQEVDIWKNKMIEALKDKELFPEQNLKKPTSQGKNKEERDIEKRDKWKLNMPPIKISEDIKSEAKERKPRKFHKRPHVINIMGKKFNFNVDFAHLEVNGPLKRWAVSKEEGIEIIINTDFPAWLSTKDTPFYAVMLIGEALAEIISKEANEYFPEKIQEIKEEILRKASELKNEFEEEVEEKKEEYRETTSFLK